MCEKYKLCLKWHAWVWRSLIPESPVRAAIMYIWVHPSCCALWSILRNSVMSDDDRLWEETMLSKMPVVMKSSFISFHFKILFVLEKLNCNSFGNESSLFSVYIFWKSTLRKKTEPSIRKCKARARRWMSRTHGLEELEWGGNRYTGTGYQDSILE